MVALYTRVTADTFTLDLFFFFTIYQMTFLPDPNIILHYFHPNHLLLLIIQIG